MDNDGYPTTEEIDEIQNWKGTMKGLADLLCELWHYPDWIHIRKRKGKTVLTMATGGWSGNEELVYALEGTMFWAVGWLKSERGGYYEFDISTEFEADWGLIIKKEDKHV